MSSDRQAILRARLLRVALRLRLVSSPSVAEVRRRIEEAGVRGSLFLCASPRTGSTMLANLLDETGLVGAPTREYFGVDFETKVLPQVGRAGFPDYLVECARKAAGTGVFGTKLLWHQCVLFFYVLRMLRDARDLSDRGLLEAVFPEPRFIWLRREDVLAQGVSWWRAKTTGAWFDHSRPHNEPAFDFNGIDTAVRWAQEQAEAWRGWFAANGIEPLQVVYEDLVADPGETVRRSLAFIGVDVPDDIAVEPQTRRQGDEVNDEWIRRYREIAETSGAGAARPQPSSSRAP